MRLDKFTLRAQEAIQAGIELAGRNQHQQVEPEHFFVAMLQQPESIVRAVLGKVGANVSVVLTNAQAAIERLPRVESAQQYFSGRTTQLFNAAQNQAEQMRDEYISTEHLLLAISAEGEGAAGKLLRQHGVSHADLLQAVEQTRGGARITDQNAEANFQALSKYTRDLTELARRGELPPVFGREDEINRVIRVLLRRSRNSPVIVGEPGVGKTAVVLGLAQRIVSGDVPEGLRNNRLVALDFDTMIAGSKYRGELEERLKALLHETGNAARQIVLCVEDLRTLTGGTTDFPFEAWRMLKSALESGKLRCVWVANWDDYEKHIEGDAAKRHYFQPVNIGQPTVEDTIMILRALKEQYEVHHGVRIKDSALVAAAQLSDNNVKNRALPAKALDLVDEAASHLRLKLDSPPEEVGRLEREAAQLEIERQALSRETDEASEARLREVEQQIERLRGQSSEAKARWRGEKEAVEHIRAAKLEIEKILIQAERYERVGDLSKAAELRYGRVVEARKRLDAEQNRLDELRRGGSFFKEEVDEEDVALIVADWVGVQASELDWSGLDWVRRD